MHPVCANHACLIAVCYQLERFSAKLKVIRKGVLNPGTFLFLGGVVAEIVSPILVRTKYLLPEAFTQAGVLDNLDRSLESGLHLVVT